MVDVYGFEPAQPRDLNHMVGKVHSGARWCGSLRLVLMMVMRRETTESSDGKGEGTMEIARDYHRRSYVDRDWVRSTNAPR
jgi:hypothetical protein